MQKRTREIIALVILLVLLVGGICGVAWYLLVGHNWNAAASIIDDRIGTMDDYTVIVCEGTAPEDKRTDESASGLVRFASGAPYALEESGFGFLFEGRLTAEKAAEVYQAKGAQTIMVHLDDPDRYDDPVIVSRNGTRYAIISAKGPHQELASRLAIRNLGKYDVSFVVCLFDDLEALREYGLGHVNLALCLDRTEQVDGEYFGSTFAVTAPRYGQIEAVIIAPSGFMIAKTIDEL